MLSALLESLSNRKHSDFILFPKVRVGFRCFSLELGKQTSVSELCPNWEKMTMLKEIPLEKELPSGINIMTVL